MNGEDVALIADIYNTALLPSKWPSVLTKIAHRLGAVGCIIFEEIHTTNDKHIAARLLSECYDRATIDKYLGKFNKQEIKDQNRFAKLSAENNEIELISDIYLQPNIKDLLKQENTQFMIEAGLGHRAGSLLNKDLYYVDRFSLQFSTEHGPILESEIKDANLFLPHMAKVIGLGRPIEERLIENMAMNMLESADQGIAVISSKGNMHYQNQEFTRIIEDYDFFKLSPDGLLQCTQKAHEKTFHKLVTSQCSHGHFGARARREAIVHTFSENNEALFIEICPISDENHLGKVPIDACLITIIDSNKKTLFNADRISTFYNLSITELKILELVINGYSNSDIADQRNRSMDTVKSQVQTILRKTNSRHRIDLIHMSRNLSSKVNYINPSCA